MHRAPPTIRTERLVLRPFAREDASEVARVLDDAEVGRFLLHVPHPYSETEALRWITAWARRWINDRGVALAITRKTRIIGAVTLTVQPDHRRAELGYWLGSAHWGQGLAAEAAGAVIDWGFRELRLERVFAQYLEGNRRSGRVLEKLGMLREGVRRAHVRKGNRNFDAHQYGVLRKEWRQRWQDRS
jgi:RimJ/RimL family protein N-acetyltransferase